MGQQAYQQNINNKRQKEIDARTAEEFGWRRNEEERRRAAQLREDEAFANLENTQAGISPDQVAAVGQTYGMKPQQVAQSLRAGGATGLQSQLTGYDTPDSYDLQNAPAPRGVGLVQRKASESDVERALGGVSMARRDTAGIRASQQNIKKLDLDAGRRAEMKRLQGLKDDELADLLGDEFSRDGSGVDAMLTFDPKQKKYLFASKIPGFPSQVLSKPELLNYAMGLWEAGNGDISAGLQTQLATITAQRGLKNQDYTRADALARGNADLHFKGLAAANDAERTGIARASARSAQSRAESADWRMVGASQDNKGLVQFNQRTGQSRVMPLPEGTDAKGLFRKITGESDRPAQTMTDREKVAYSAAVKELAELDPQAPPSAAAAVFRKYGLDPEKFGVEDPVAKLIAQLSAQEEASPQQTAAPARSAAPVPARVEPMERLRGFYLGNGQQPQAPMSTEEALKYLNR